MLSESCSEPARLSRVLLPYSPEGVRRVCPRGRAQDAAGPAAAPQQQQQTPGLAPWMPAGLLQLQPLQPLRESLWLLLRSGDSARPKFNALLQWWGGTRLEARQLGHGRPTGRAPGSWWSWLRRAGPAR